MTNKVADILTGLVSILVALAFYVQGTELAFESNIYPMTMEIFLVITGIYMIVRGVRDNSGEAKDKTDINYTRGAVIVVATALYLIGIKFIGFYVTSFAFLVLVSWYLSDKGLTIKSLGVSTVFAVILIAAVYGTFSLFLDVPTPAGILF
ncbi:tripartite tricarboxylate transporter TctB family protein [Desulfotomaculum sp. 1211_IL3151]|uniref:tripartite tricarboxylate transporter TctB family protein n=1 Tax=Desulfotomaculum sp. 1211_IL3151 TaxID=3084055 RepID=UPI002FDB5CA3